MALTFVDRAVDVLDAAAHEDAAAAPVRPHRLPPAVVSRTLAALLFQNRASDLVCDKRQQKSCYAARASDLVCDKVCGKKQGGFVRGAYLVVVAAERRPERARRAADLLLPAPGRRPPF